VCHSGDAQLLRARLGELRVRHARVRLARLLADEAGAFEALEQPRDAGRGQQNPLREIDATQHLAVGMRQVQQHLVVVQRQAVLALELDRELARDRSMRAQERDPGLELLLRC